MAEKAAKAELYTRYPISSIISYNGVTLLHFLLGGVGIALGYGPSWAGYTFAGLYLVFALAQMYVLMPLTVCPHCGYYRLDGGLCVSGLNVVSRKMAREGDARLFPGRAKGPLCHNNLYMASLLIPILAMIPALVIEFSLLLLAVLGSVVALLLYRFFVVFPKIACLHCRVKHVCPNAEPTGVREL